MPSIASVDFLPAPTVQLTSSKSSTVPAQPFGSHEHALQERRSLAVAPTVLTFVYGSGQGCSPGFITQTEKPVGFGAQT